MTDIQPELAICAEKALWGWYDRQAPGAGKTAADTQLLDIFIRLRWEGSEQVYFRYVYVAGGGVNCGYLVVSVDQPFCFIIVIKVFVEISSFLVCLKRGLWLNWYFNFLTLLFLDNFNHVFNQFIN